MRALRSYRSAAPTAPKAERKGDGAGPVEWERPTREDTMIAEPSAAVHLRALADHYAGLEIIRLSRNYRSHQAVLSLANVVRPQADRFLERRLDHTREFER